jgi:hypothetical protein
MQKLSTLSIHSQKIVYLWMQLLLFFSVLDFQQIKEKVDQVENLKRNSILMSDRRNMQVLQRHVTCLK